MSIPKPTKGLLSAREKERLEQRFVNPDAPKEETDKLIDIRKRNDLVVRNKIKSWLNNIDDIKFILRHLPAKQLRKTISDDEVYSLLELVETLLDIMDFMPVGFTEKEIEYQGKKTKTTMQYVEKSIIVAPQSDGEVSIQRSVRDATKEDIKRHGMLKEHIDRIKYFIDPDPDAHHPDIRSAEYFKDQINSAHKQGLIALAYDMGQPTEEEPK